MPVLLMKTITRECFATSDHVTGRKLIVSLDAGDTISVRLKGRRTRYTVPVKAIMYMGIANYLEEAFKAKIKRHSERKALGLRTRRPRRPSMIFRKQIYEALSMR